MKLIKISYVIAFIATIFASCQKEYSLEGAVTSGSGTWQFNDSSTLYSGTMDTAFIETAGATKILHLIGRSANGQQVFNLNLYKTDSLTTGTYKASLSEADFQYYTIAKTLYDANSLVGEFVVSVTVLSNKTVTGTFSGAALDSAGQTKNLTLGKFTSKIDLSTNTSGGGGGTGTSIGTLGNSSGVCAPISTSGTYTQGIALNSSNTASVQVNVTTPGTYTISTNTVNGVSFSGTGTFTAAGPNTVVLTGAGTPLAPGTQTYTVAYGSSNCTFSVNFAAGTPPSNSLVCSSIVVNGAYTQGTIIGSTNTVQVQVNVVSPGSYNITTSGNGMTFSSSGNFSITGSQTITLSGSGSPLQAINQLFTITLGTSTCTFTISAASLTSNDYFPITAGSFWVYGNTDKDPTDSSIIAATNRTKTIGANLYNAFTFDWLPPIRPTDSLFYRKASGIYYENFDVEDFYGFDPGSTNSKNIEYIFLNEAANVNSPWQSPTTTGTITAVGPGTYSIYIKVTLLAKAVTATSGVVTSNDVMKLKYEYYVSGGLFGATPFLFSVEERWFARGIGLIYNSFDDQTGGAPSVYAIGRYKVF